MATTDGTTNLPLLSVGDGEKIIRMGLAGLELNNVPADTAFALSHEGIGLQYDITGTKKTFSLTSNGVEWGDGTTTYTTPLGRLCAVQQAFQAIELPPNTTTLSVNNTILVQDPTANQIGATIIPSQIRLDDTSIGHNDHNTISTTNITLFQDNNPNAPNQTYNEALINPSQIQVIYTDNNTGITYSSALTNGAGVVLDSNTFSQTGQDNIQTAMVANSATGNGEIRVLDTTAGVPAPLNVIASNLLLNGTPVGGGGGSQNLSQVLTTGNDAGNQAITNVYSIACSNFYGNGGGVMYFQNPVSGLSLGSTMVCNSNDITGVNNLQVSTINGLSPTILGLNWSDFTASNAYNNLPNQSYQVYSYPYTTTQSNSFFRVENQATPDYSTLTDTYLEFYNTPSSTSTSYSTNNLTITNNTDFTIAQTGGANINLNCNQLVINGTPYSPPVAPPKRWGYYSNTSPNTFSIPSGNWYNIGAGGSPIITLSGMSATTSYTIGIQFTCIMDSAEPTGAIYLNYSNTSGGFTNCLYSSSRPCPANVSYNTFSSGDATQFVITDSLIFVSGTSGELYIDLYAGHNGGSWGGNFYWSFNAYIISP